ncbi:MAG TPA: pilus assembly protein TadG-related protein, partial [Candidatus Sulfopaludibacter sp.]|nr:pilus assembly protein TadG-related protein [Candidatus Sulfopaludibacter sp.]
MSLQLLVVMVPVLFAMMGFALDLGRMYLIRGELNQAANAMALAAASQLLGTDASTGNATTAAQLSLDNTNGTANLYNFGSLPIGQTSGNLTSTVNPPAFFATVADATAAGAAISGNQADGTTARQVLINLNADAPLVFFALLPGGESGKTSIAAQAVAGISAPVCVACGIEPFAVGALNSSDPQDFGFVNGALYTLYFNCQGNPPPLSLAPGSAVAPYVIINRLDANNTAADESQQLYRDGAGGLLPSSAPNPTGSVVPMGCVSVGDSSESLWPSAIPGLCTSTAGGSVADALCGLQSRLDNTDPFAVCANFVADFGALAAAYTPDTDQVMQQADPYSAYLGNGRRILTLPVVDTLTLTATGTMTVLGFRQFFLERNADGTANSPTDSNGRFVAMYIGSP